MHRALAMPLTATHPYCNRACNCAYPAGREWGSSEIIPSRGETPYDNKGHPPNTEVPPPPNTEV